MSKFFVKNWKSKAMWPTDGDIKLGHIQNISEDTHATEEIAKGICRLLKRDGFDGNKKVFPIATWYEPVIEETSVKEDKPIKWRHVPAEGQFKESLEGYDKDHLQVVFAVLYTSGWCLIAPRVSHFRTDDVEEVKRVAEQYFKAEK